MIPQQWSASLHRQHKNKYKGIKFKWKPSYFNIVKWDKPESVTFLLALTWSNCRVSAKGKSIFKHESFMYWQLWIFNDFRSFKSSEIWEKHKQQKWRQAVWKHLFLKCLKRFKHAVSKLNVLDDLQIAN